MTMMDESYREADTVIKALLVLGHDYTRKREDITRMFDSGIFDGNWDTSSDWDDLPGLRFIQEDEYEQHMDDDPDKPDDPDLYVSGVYIWIGN